MKRREGSKLLSILLTLALVFSMIPGMSLTAYADDDISYEDLDNITTPEYFDSGEWYPVDNDDDTETVLSEECIEADTTTSGTAVITGAGDSNVNKEYTDFSDAFTAWKGASPADGQDLTLKLLENVEINFPVSLDGANTLTLDLNGHGIKNKGTDAVIVVNHSNAYLNLKDSGSDVSHNYTVFEGLAYVNDSASGTGVKTFTGGYITGGSGNSDPNYGGGICIRNGHVTLSGGNIIGNEAASGGGVYVDQGHFEMTGGKICGNRAIGSGGGVYVNDSGTFTMTGGMIEDNIADGATVYTYGGNVNISGSASVNDSIQAENNGTVTITGGKFYYPYDPTQFLTSAYKAYGYNSDGSLESFNITEGGYWIVGFKYPVYVDGTQVTNINAGDVLGDGKVSYTPAVEDDPATTDVDESAPATLSLNGYSSNGVYRYGNTSGAIYAGEALTIELSGKNTIDNDYWGNDSNGIFGSKALTIKGEGELTVKGLNNGIRVLDSLTIESGTVTAIATTEGENGRGIYANNSITISGGTVTAEDSGTNGYGIISSGGPITISGGTVTASATGTGGTGIWAEEIEGVYIEKNSEVTAIGNDRAINSYVLNAIAGTGWTDMAGTEGRTLISVSETGQDLSSYKKVLIQLHTHDFSYSADMDILTATCTVSGCTLSDNKVELSIIAPTLTTYGETGEGISANATLSGLDEFNDVTDRSLSANDIKYAGRNETTYAESTTAPVNAGDYKAMITLSNVKTSAGEGNSVTAGVEYSIARAAMTVSSNSYEGTYDGAAHSITVTAPDGAVIRYRTAASGDYDLTGNPEYTDVSENTVYYQVTKENYIPVEGNETVKISEAALTDVSVSQNGTLTYTGSPQVPEVMEKATAVGGQSVTFTYSRTESGEYGQMPSVTNVSDSGIFYYKATAPNHSDATGSFTVTVDKAANPATVTTEATVIEGGNTIDLKDTVSMNGATGEVSYAFGGDAMDCTLDGSVLTSGTKTGTVNINVAVAEDDNYNALPATPVTVTITNKGIQTISANDVMVTYGDTDKSVSAEVTDPKTGAGKISYAVKEGNTDYIEVNEETGALNIKEVPADGKAYVTVTAAETMIYAKATRDVAITINKAASTAATVSANNLTYDTGEHDLVTVTGEATGGTMNYVLGKDAVAAPASGWETTIPKKSDAGTYYVWYMVKGDGNHNDTRPSVVEVKIDPIEVKSIGLRAVNGTTMVPGTSQQIEATIVPSNASVKYLTWSSSNPVVSVNNAGLITVKPDNDIVWGDKKAVEAVITAEAEKGVKASITITVVNPKTEVKSVEIDKTSVKKDAKPGDTFRLTAVIKPDEATDKTVTWESDKPEVAEVGEYTGIVTVKKTGDAKITVWAARGTLSDNTVLNIRKVSVNGITIDTTGGDDYLVTGRAAGLSAIVTPADATEKGVIWSSDPEDVASVDEHGIVTAKKEGRVRITAASIDNPSVKASKDFIVFGSDDSLYVEFVGSSDYTYTGSAITPAVNVYYRGEMLTSDADYTVSYKNNKNANDASNVKKAPTVKVTGKTVAATAEAVFKILPADIGDEDLVTAQEVTVASGKKAAPELYFGGTKLAGKDFTNPFAKDKFYNSRPITVYGKGNFTGEREIWINVKTEQEVKNQPKIKVKSFTPVKRSYNGLSQLLSDNEITVVSSTDKGKTKTPLTMDKDFYIAYPGDTTNAGTVKIAVVGMGDYTGVVTKTYRIEAAGADDVAKEGVEVSFPYSEDTHTEGEVDYDIFTYRPGGVQPYVNVDVTLKSGEVETLISGRDYKVTYKDNKKAAKANKDKLSTATITFKGNYKSLKKVEKKFYITQAYLGDASVYTQDKVVTKGDAKYPLQAPIVDIDGVTVKKNEYTVTYTDADDKPLNNQSKLNLKDSGDSADVKVKITPKKANGNYTGENTAGSYVITLADASNDLSKAKVIIQKKGDPNHKAVRKFDFTGKPIVIGEEPNEGYELYVYFGKKANAPDKILEEGTDYTVEYSNNVKAGKATIILNSVDGSEKCFGSRTHSFNIVKGIMRWVKR